MQQELSPYKSSKSFMVMVPPLGSGDGGMDSRNRDEEGNTGWDKDRARIFSRIDVEFILIGNLSSSSSSEKSSKNLEKYSLFVMISFVNWNKVGKVPRIKNFGDPMIENDFEDIVGCQNVIRMNSNALA
ncbi:hypothetical protein GIB67_022543 [Kingdonia uniflora]|uniref:Uncharacterized protein n=1 Tax=Kingdonia uniflora TaxID=39325 RepID=A0A7J7L7H0_9MAGN|nr:hypothetical protein GIB67_022543 [Kingdonia uniflora]